MKKLCVFGTGCPKCQTLTHNAEAAADALGIEYQLEKVTDINAIIKAGVMVTPALAIDGELKASGRVPGIDEIKTWLAG